MKTIKVHRDKKTSSSYEIYIGNGIIDRMGLLLAKHTWGERYIIITDDIVSALHGTGVERILKEMGLKIDMVEFPAGETSKDMQTTLRIVDRLMALGGPPPSSHSAAV